LRDNPDCNVTLLPRHTVKLNGAEQAQTNNNNNKKPNRKPHCNIPNEKLTLLLQQGGPLPSTTEVKNQNNLESPNLNRIYRSTSLTNG
jgi:hypothetical protein